MLFADLSQSDPLPDVDQTYPTWREFHRLGLGNTQLFPLKTFLKLDHLRHKEDPRSYCCQSLDQHRLHFLRYIFWLDYR